MLSFRVIVLKVMNLGKKFLEYCCLYPSETNEMVSQSINSRSGEGSGVLHELNPVYFLPAYNYEPCSFEMFVIMRGGIHKLRSERTGRGRGFFMKFLY